MIEKPENHVTRALAASARSTFGPAPPELPASLLVWLEQQYPPRCLSPRETVEDHLRYAGKVDLVATLRTHFEDQLAGLDAADEDGLDLTQAERANP